MISKEIKDLIVEAHLIKVNPKNLKLSILLREMWIDVLGLAVDSDIESDSDSDNG